MKLNYFDLNTTCTGRYFTVICTDIPVQSNIESKTMGENIKIEMGIKFREKISKLIPSPDHELNITRNTISGDLHATRLL